MLCNCSRVKSNSDFVKSSTKVITNLKLCRGLLPRCLLLVSLVRRRGTGASHVCFGCGVRTLSSYLPGSIDLHEFSEQLLCVLHSDKKLIGRHRCATFKLSLDFSHVMISDSTIDQFLPPLSSGNSTSIAVQHRAILAYSTIFPPCLT